MNHAVRRETKSKKSCLHENNIAADDETGPAKYAGHRAATRYPKKEVRETSRLGTAYLLMQVPDRVECKKQ
jgi:hypothetical protein